MNEKERRRLAVLEQVREDKLTLKAAAEQLELSYRQARRVYRRLKEQGDRGLIHGLRGRPVNRATDRAFREEVVRLYCEHYGDFGCPQACEMLLERHGLAVGEETLRRWLIEQKAWRRRRRSPVKRQRRERRSCFGALVQLDGSHHDWFEGRGERCVLMVMIDDATGWTLARFFESETTAAAMTIFEQWSRLHGLPLELYPDQDSIYRVNSKGADEQELRTGKRPQTQFGRAMAELGVKLICAKSPQAKGRVERMNGTLQDRLIKAMRLEGISTIEAANLFLEQTFLPQLNERFTVEAAEERDVHRAVDEATLTAALCVKEERKVGRDHCVQWEGRMLQLKVSETMVNLAGKRVTVSRSLAGELSVAWRGQTVAWTAVRSQPKRGAAPPSLVDRVSQHKGPGKPSADHPWRGNKKGRTTGAGGAAASSDAGATGAEGARPLGGAGSAAASAAPRPPLHQPHPAA